VNAVIAFVAKDSLNRAVAQAAFTVVEKNPIRERHSVKGIQRPCCTRKGAFAKPETLTGEETIDAKHKHLRDWSMWKDSAVWLQWARDIHEH
jgi:hypothetical protein